MARARKDAKVVTDGGPSHELLLELSRDIEGMGMVADMDEEIFVPVFFSTSLNRCTGIGGWPLRRMGMMHGPPGVGKSVMALGIAESMRRFGHVPVIFDTEQAAEKRWYNDLSFGKGTLFKQPDNLDDVIWNVQELINRLLKKKSGKGGKAIKDIGFCFVVDTMTKLIPKEALEIIKEEGIKRGYSAAALWTTIWTTALMPQLRHTNSVLLAVVQERANMERKGPFDAKNRPAGAEDSKFANSMCIDVTHRTPVKKGKLIVGAHHHFQVTKNKVDGAQKTEGSFFTSNGLGDIPVGFDLAREAVEEVKVRKCAVLGKDRYDRQVVRLKVGEWESEIEGGWETVREKCRDDEEWFGEFVGALNIDARRE